MPAELSQLELLQQDCWPLAITTLLSARSNIPELSKQQGMFFFGTPCHSQQGDLAAADVLQHVHSRMAGVRSAPLFTLSLISFYEGIRETKPGQQLPEIGLLLFRISRSNRDHSNPAFVGSCARGANLFHGPASNAVAVLLRMPQLSRDGSHVVLGPVRVLLRTQVAVADLQQPQHWAVDDEGAKFRKGEQLEDWGWDYSASTSDPKDPALGMRCCCPACKRRLSGWRRARLPADAMRQRDVVELVV